MPLSVVAFGRTRLLHPLSPNNGIVINIEENFVKTTETIAQNYLPPQTKEDKKSEAYFKRTYSCIVTTSIQQTKVDLKAFNASTYISVTHLQMNSHTKSPLHRSTSI